MRYYEVLSNCCDALIVPIPQGYGNPDGFMYRCTECDEPCDGYLFREEEIET